MKPTYGTLVGNMIVKDADDYGGYKLCCISCGRIFDYCEEEGQLKNYRYRPDFSITAQCPKCNASWEIETNLEDLDEDMLFKIEIDYKTVAPDGKSIITKSQVLPSSSEPMLNVILNTFATAGKTCRITAISVTTISREEYAELVQAIADKIDNTMTKLFSALFGDGKDVPES